MLIYITKLKKTNLWYIYKYEYTIKKEYIMSNQITYFIDGIYSAFSFSGKYTKVNRRAKKASYYSSTISTNSKINLKKSMTRLSISASSTNA